VDQLPTKGESLVRFYNVIHKHYCGIDLHARSMYICVMDQAGTTLFHRDLRTDPNVFLKAITPFRENLVVAVECIFTWYWLADLCAREGIDFVLGHALYMKAIHGGKAKNDRIDSLKIATLLRGGMLPQSYVYPPEMRSTRDLLRRRLTLVRQRGLLLAHIQNTHHQYNLPTPKARITYRCNREGIAENFSDPSVSQSVSADIELAGHYDALIRDLELFLTQKAKVHDVDNFYRLRSIPGVGKILAMTLLYEIHDIDRFERVQNFASYARLVKCEKSSSGKRLGIGGAKIGNVHLKWAFSEAAVLFLRGNPPAQRYAEKLRRKHGKAKALSILAHKLGRAVYFMLKQQRPFSLEAFRIS
jgi:transposase